MADNTQAKSMLDYALAYARQNLRVLPLHSIHSGDCSCGRDACTSQGKHPRTSNGAKDATSDPEQIQHWWNSYPLANIGIATGNGLYVIDVDSAKGGNYESLASLGVESLDWTLTARTGSGGYHFYLLCSEPLKNTANRLGPFIDTRGEGGYVVAPPSYNKYGRYTWCAGNTAMQVLPEGVLARLKEPKAPSAGSLKLYPGYQAQKEKQAYAETSTPDQNITPTVQPASAQASTASRALVPPANVAQEARNNYLVSMAGRLRVHGFHANEICAMLSALNDERYGMGCHPEGPLSAEELDRTIFQSVAKWEETLGVQPSTLPEVEALGSLMTRAIPEAIWLVPGLLSEGLVLFAGKPKLGKSWLALSLALTCALGSEDKGGLALGRYEVKPAGVLYLSLEERHPLDDGGTVELCLDSAATVEPEHRLRLVPAPSNA